MSESEAFEIERKALVVEVSHGADKEGDWTGVRPWNHFHTFHFSVKVRDDALFGSLDCKANVSVMRLQPGVRIS